MMKTSVLLLTSYAMCAAVMLTNSKSHNFELLPDDLHHTTLL